LHKGRAVCTHVPLLNMNICCNIIWIINNNTILFSFPSVRLYAIEYSNYKHRSHTTAPSSSYNTDVVFKYYRMRVYLHHVCRKKSSWATSNMQRAIIIVMGIIYNGINNVNTIGEENANNIYCGRGFDISYAPNCMSNNSLQ